jgi:Right handed beta helix region
MHAKGTFGRLLLFVGAMTLAATVLAMGASASAPPGPYTNGFENAADAVSIDNGTADPMFGVTRVASGTGGITSAAGSWHATAALDSGAFTRYGGYSSTFPAGGYTTSADIYLDMAASTPGADLRFDWSSAISNTSGNHRRDFIFSVGTDGLGGFVMSASNNAPGWPADPGRDPFTINETGWYTFADHFYDSGSGVLADDLTVSALGSTTPLHTWTLSDPTDIIGTTVGGNRYGWLVDNALPLALDNVTRSGIVAPTCQTVNTSLGSFTAAVVDPGTGYAGPLPVSGCQIGVYFDTAGSVTNADLSGATYYGVFADKGAAVNVTGSQIHQIGDSPFSGNQHGRAVFYANGATGTVSGNTITAYQKNGIVATDAKTAVSVLNNTVTGRGHINTIAQNGIVILSGATALIKGNTVTANWYTPQSTVACGLLFIGASGVKQQANSLSDNEVNLCNVGRGGGNTSS